MLPVAILAGGLATRLRPITEIRPKALIDVNGEPFAFHQLRLLRRQGIGHVVYCLGFLGEQVVDTVGDGARFGLRIDYSFDGPTLVGTAGALKVALPLLGDAFFVLYGDSYLQCDYGAIERCYFGAGKPALMTVFRNDGRWDASNVEFADGRIVEFSKRQRTPRMRHIDFGLGVMDARTLEDLPPQVPVDLADLYERLAKSGSLAAFEVTDRFYEIGSHAGLDEFRHHLKGVEPQ